MARKLTKGELERRGLEYRMVYMKGYREGLKAGALQTDTFVTFLMEIGDPNIVKKVQNWAEKEKTARKQEPPRARLCDMCINNPRNGGNCGGGMKECNKHIEAARKAKK